MSRHRLVLLGLFVILVTGGLLSYALVLAYDRPGPSPQGGAAADRPDPTVRIATERITAAEQQEARLRVAELSRLAVEQEKRQHAAAKMPESRKDLQFARMAAWSQVIATNRTALTALRQQAASSKDGQTPCTLCDGKGYMRFCVSCQDQGKCPTCQGSGHAPHDEYCPTCLGTGKCYLCFGFGRMPCPFCDDGMITRKCAAPPAFMPVD